MSCLAMDKTGTLTKNIMDFSKLVVPNGSILNLNTKNEIPLNIVLNNINLIKCLGLCIHINNGKFSTPEDEIIRKRYYYLGCNIFQDNDNISIILPNSNKFNYKLFYIDKLEFTSHRKRSSVIVKDENNNYFLYCKGSVNTLKMLVKNEQIRNIELCDKCIIEKHADLRVLAAGYKKLVNFTPLNKYSDEYLSDLEKDMEYLGLIGLKDNLQENINNTVKYLEINKKFISVCTGDRKETAIAISKECGIIHDDNELDISDINDLLQIKSIKNKTILFDGSFLSTNVLNNYDNLLVFYELLKNSKNFVGYSLLPKHKKTS